ncbi:GNAT family N-acetyltransferase [Flavobacterium sp. '19STA2R22 D10 B1']|uniref:GNAT family N-acetyltransferase n=1 Tax=Flavobacterium aerium TaxID=3037261 RepID=UPI00278BEA20|nr:GNAT family N-acetyltransferase [Flavobacterium sp. '19STA2R22 D10 B1']
MEIQHEDNGKKGMFFVKDEAGKIIAEMSYVWAGDASIIIDHTEVDPVLKGKGIGKQLVSKSVDLAREKKVKIIPLCPFAKSVFEKVETFQDVL